MWMEELKARSRLLQVVVEMKTQLSCLASLSSVDEVPLMSLVLQVLQEQPVVVSVVAVVMELVVPGLEWKPLVLVLQQQQLQQLVVFVWG